MKLAEALIERAEIKKQNGQLMKRVKDNVRVQEGDSPAENYEELLSEIVRNMERLLVLTQRINETNIKTAFGSDMNIAEAIAVRDCLGAKIRVHKEIYEKATINPDRYTRNEIKFVRCIDIKELQKQIDQFAKDYREMDTKIQGLNWTVELL